MSTPTRPRRATKLRAVSTIADSDSEDEFQEQEASPPPRKRPAADKAGAGLKGKAKGKRRVSDIHASPRTPLADVELNLNDDAAERRARRQSLKHAAAAAAAEVERGPKVERQNSDKSVVGANASMAANITANKSTRVAALAMVNAGGHQISSVAPQQPPPSLQILSSNFEEWMKMATDNKINATNSWHFALIDYFHDMSLLRNELDNSINFQKASCTLDGCVKIWTSRVDSVATETGKLLSGLADDGRDDGRDDDGNEDGAAEGEEGAAKAKRRTHRSEVTLAKSYAQLQVKKFDLEFTVDPLFKKTSADFDEGGAMGLLMNHLGVDGSLRIVFDAGDCKLEDDDAEEDLAEMKGAEVDLSSLRAKYFPSMDVLDDKVISSTLGDFKFSADSHNLDLAFLNLDRSETEGPTGETGDGFGEDDGNLGGADGGDFFTGDQAVEDDGGGWAGAGGWGGDDDNGNGGDAGEPGQAGPAMGGQRVGLGGAEAFDPRQPQNERALVMALAGDGEGALDYFDQNLLKNWAGPEHWKMRKVIRKAPESSTAASKASKAEKKAFEIDFTTPPPSQKQLFAASGRTAILLPGTKAPAKRKRSSRSKAAPPVKRDEHLLPDDMHFSSAQLLRLFMKPKFALRMRRHGHVINEEDGEVDERFWAQAAADQAGGFEGDQTQDGGAIPFGTQFFMDDFDDGPGFDDVDDGFPGAAAAMDEEGDLLAATQEQLKRVRPEFVNYSKRAKRVDVRKLKENIWKGLNIVVDHVPQEQTEKKAEELVPTDPSEGREFGAVVQELKKSYPKDKLDDISTSFCFICVLHLANEQGLKLDAGEPDESGERTVRDIWDLKVFRDPNATAAA